MSCFDLIFWLWYFFSQCISVFSLSLCNMVCHNDLKSFPWKKIRCRESKLPQKEKNNEQKSDNLQFLGRHCSSVLTTRTRTSLSYNFNTEIKFYYPQMLLLLWIYIALLVNLSHLIIEKLIAILFLQSKKHYLIWNAGVEVKCLMGADMFIPREMCTVCGLPLDCELF